MIEKFLKAKHWHLFIATFGVVMIFQFYFLSQITTHSNPISLLPALRIFPLVLIIIFFIMFGWQWSITIGLLDKLPEGVVIPVKRYKIFFAIVALYFSIITIGLIFIFNGGFLRANFNPLSLYPIFALIIPLHFFSMIAIIHNMYFAAKVMKSVESGKEADFSACAGEFFLIWFFPIGIWFLQPRLNKLIDKNEPLEYSSASDIVDDDFTFK